MIKKLMLVMFLLISTSIGPACFEIFGAVTPSALKCEYFVDPKGIDSLAPRLSWILISGERGQKQTAYQILVASSKKKLVAGIADLWDSKKVNSDQSIHIVYQGRPLKSRMTCFWKVRIWDKDVVPSDWSQDADWSMGLLKQSDWKARWICYDTRPWVKKRGLQLPPCPYFRKTFTVYEKLRKATLYVSALGLFETSINGKRVGRDHFMPGWTNYSKRVYYKAYPVTDLVRKGENVIGAVLSNGWYAGYVGFAPRHTANPRRRAFYGEIPAFIAQLDLEYADGKRVTILTDRSWKASTGPIREADIQMGETYDARLEIPGWDRPFFDDRTWVSAKFHDAIVPRLESYPADPVQRIQTIQPVNITQPQPGVYVFNMGQNFAGYAKIKIKGNRGARIVLRYAEMLHKDGSVMTENLRDARATDTYYLKGDDSSETWQPRFTYHGFQYVEVLGLTRKPDLDTVTGIVLHSSLAETGSFECSSDLVNNLYRNIVWTQRSNFFDIPTDCPQRDERLGWSGDAQIYARSAAYNTEIAAFMSKWLVALEDDQRPSGAFPDFAPMPFLQFEPSPGWMDAGVICTYILYKVYGDTRIIKKHYRAMKRFMDYLERTSTNYLRFPKENCWGDWQALGAQTPQDLIATAYYAYDAKLMAEMASVIGNSRDSRQYSILADNIKNAFSQAYVTSQDRLKGDTQTAYALAIYMKLLPDKMIGVAGERLVELIKNRNWHISTGFLGIKHILPALSETGHSAVACRLLENRTYPSWGYSIANGATTVWERWDSYTKNKGFQNPEMNSFSHYAFGSVCEWMFSSMAGIDTDGAGFKRIIIRPRIQGCEITSTKATYNSIHGLISSEWQIKNGKFILDTTIPPNTTATVYLPAEDLGRITEGGQPVGSTDSVKLLSFDGHDAVFSIDSGNYQFESKIPQEIPFG